MSKLTWLHLSDIHFRPHSIDSFEEYIVFEELFEQIEREAKEGVKPEIIFITGDIADNGKDYSKAEDFFDKLIT